MPAVAIPLAGLTVIATLLGGHIALRLHHSLPTVIALTGGIVVAVALFDVLPEGIENVGDTSRATALVAVGFLALLLRRAGAGSAPSRRPRRGARARTGRGPRRPRPLRPQLHRRPRDRPRVRPRRYHRVPRLHRRRQPRLRRWPQHRQLHPQPVRRSQAGDTLADGRCDRAAAGGDRRLAADGLRRRRSATCSASTAASSSTWARPTCSPRPMPTPPGRKSG